MDVAVSDAEEAAEEAVISEVDENTEESEE